MKLRSLVRAVDWLGQKLGDISPWFLIGFFATWAAVVITLAILGV